MTLRELVDLLKVAGIQSIPFALVLAAVALLVYKLAEVLLKRVLELRRLELDKDLETFKAELARAAQTQHVAFTKLHQERFEAVLKLAKLLDSTDLAMRQLVSRFSLTGAPPPKSEQASTAAKAAKEGSSRVCVGSLMV